jgi:hypothetical protein
MTTPLHLEAWEETLFELGFTREGSGYRRDGWLLKAHARWAWLEAQSTALPGAALNADLGQQGLWKSVRAGGAERRVFDLPADVLLDGTNEEYADDCVPTPLEQCLTWAEVTANGSVPRGWQPPSRQLLDSWLPRKRLTIQVGAHVCQGELIASDGNLAVRFPILLALPEDLPEGRLRWLRALFRDAQDRARMVRIGFARAEESTSVLAECDLTGAPHWACESLILASLDGLDWVFRWLSESSQFLADAGIVSRALELCAVHATTENRKEQT